jgi:hypothetical protein
MVISILAGGYALLVLILMVLTRHGQPRVPYSDPNPIPNPNDNNFIFFV